MAAGTPGLVTGSGGPLHGIVIATSGPNDSSSNNLTTFTDMQGMQAGVSVPTAVGNAVLDLRFSAESRCTGPAAGGGASDWCAVQILVDGVAALPVDFTTRDFAFDATNNGTATSGNWGAHAMERCWIVRPGDHRITVQGEVTATGVTFWTGERTLAIEWDRYQSGSCGSPHGPGGPLQTR